MDAGVESLADARSPVRAAGVVGAVGPVIGVVGGCGGVGASRFAAGLAGSAAKRMGSALLVDLDSAGGGIDVLLGAESVAGPRWSGLRMAGGRFDPDALMAGLPAWGNVAMLASDGPTPPAEIVAQVIDSGAQAAPTVLDLSRHPSTVRDAATVRCVLVVLVVACDLGALTGALAVRASLGQTPIAIVARGSRRASLRAAASIGCPLIGSLPALRRRDEAPLRIDAIPRSLGRVVRGVLDAVESP